MSSPDLRHYLCPIPTAPGRRRTIVRDGELLIGPASENLADADPDTRRALSEAQILIGTGIEHLPDRLQWRARVPGFGYLEIEADGRLVVAPAVCISEDRLKATIDLRSPTGDESPVARHEYDAAIEAAGVREGISTNRLEAAWKIFESTGSLPSPMLFASGTPPKPGVGAGIKYFIDIERHTGTVFSIDGQIDFRDQHRVVNVFRLQEIGRWATGSPPVPGIGVDGVELSTEEVGEDVPLRVGQNVRTREGANGSILLLAEIEGILLISEDGTPSVTDVLELPGDVDLSTGNVVANATVIVGGSVRSGFLVDALRDIVVRGTVEGADLRAGGSVTIGAGLIGEDDTKVIAKGKVTVKYSQNAWIETDGDVEISGSETASFIMCRGSIKATDGKGRLQGGHYRAGGSIVVRELGSELGVRTRAEAGVDPLNQREVERTKQALRELTAEERRQRHSTTAPAGKEPPGQGAGKRRKFLNAQLAKLQETAGAGDAATITVLGKAYYGTEISIGRHAKVLDETMTAPTFVVDRETGGIELKG